MHVNSEQKYFEHPTPSLAKTSTLTLEQLWQETGFTPNTNQRDAILHVNGPLYLPAGPGSGKTRVLLWLTLNLCVFHGVSPEQIFLATFTDKAAFQLKEGLKQLFGLITTILVRLLMRWRCILEQFTRFVRG